MSNLQLNKVKLGIKIGTEVTLKLSSNVFGDSNDEDNFLIKSSLTNTQVSRISKAFANNPPANTKSSKNQFHKIGQSGGFLGWLLGPLLKTGLSLMKNVLKILAKRILIPLGLTAVASAIDAAIHKKIFGSDMTTLIISNEEMNDITKIVKWLKKLVHW